MAIPVITSVLRSGGNRNHAFAYQITATGSPVSYDAMISPSGLPPGLSINTATGLISGTPTAQSNWTIHISATNGDGTGSANLSLHVVAPNAPYVNSVPTATGEVGVPFTYQITAGGNTATSYNATFMPDGLTVDGMTGLISGTPTLAGAFSSGRIYVINAAGSDSVPMQYSIDPGSGGKPAITSNLSATIFLGDDFSYQITATNTPTSFDASDLPAGLSVNTSTGLIDGTTSAAPGQYIVPIEATNGVGTGNANLVINILAQGGVPPPDLNIPKGVSSYTPLGQAPQLGAISYNLVSMISLGASWASIEAIQGSYDFSYFTTQIKRIAIQGKKILLRIQTGSGFKSAGGNVPNYVATSMGVDPSDKHITPGLTYTFDPSQGGPPICFPVFWNPVYWARKKALYQAWGDWLTTTSDLTAGEKNAVSIISVSYGNARTEDFNIPHSPQIKNTGGPDGTGYVLSELNRWLHLPSDPDPGAGYTTQKMIDIALRSDNQGLIDVAIAAFPGKFITHATGSNGASLDAPGDENYLCRTVYDAAKSKYPNRFIIQRNNVSTLTPIETVSSGTAWELMGDEAEAGAPLAGQNLAAIWGDTTDTGGNGYRMNGGRDTDPDGVLPPPLTASQIYRKSSQKIASYGAFYLEVYEKDIVSQSIEDTDYVQSLFSGSLIGGGGGGGDTPVITSPLSLVLNVGDTKTYQIAATNNPTSFDAQIQQHPEGLQMDVNTTTGVLTFTGIRASTYRVAISATVNPTGTALLIVTVNPVDSGGGGTGGGPPPQFTILLLAFPEVPSFAEDFKEACLNYAVKFGLQPPKAVTNLVVTTPHQSNSGVATASWTPPSEN